VEQVKIIAQANKLSVSKLKYIYFFKSVPPPFLPFYAALKTDPAFEDGFFITRWFSPSR